MKLVKAMATVAGMTGLSRIAGFVRDAMTASFLGAGPLADAFFVALKLPNFFRRVTAEGAFSIAFVPLYSKTIETENKIKADDFASNTFSVMLLFLSLATVLALLFMPFVIWGIAPGLSKDSQWLMLASELSRVTFPYLLLMSLTALLGGVMNAHNRFAPFAFAPVLFNVALIISMLLSGLFETVGHALSWGVLGAGVLQFLFLLVCARRAGIRIRIMRPRFDVKIRKVFKLMGPAILGAGVIHVNLFADLIMASLMGGGAISYLYYADRLNQLPLGIVGIAVGTALLPILSKAMTQPDKAEANDLFNRALEYCLLLALPASIALLIVPQHIIGVLFERGAFTPADTVMTSRVLMAYAIGLPAYIAIKVFSTVHWSREDTKTPVRISIIATLINIAMSLVLIQFIGIVGIALATGVTGWLQFVLHLRALRGHDCARLDARFIRNAVKIVMTSIAMGGAVYATAFILQNALAHDSLFVQIIALGGVVMTGLGVYIILLFMTRLLSISMLKNFIRGTQTHG